MMPPTVVKMFPGAQAATRAPATGARAEAGPDGPRAALVRPPAEQAERLGAAADRLRPGSVAAAYGAAAPRAPDREGRRLADRRLQGMIETLARLLALEAGLRDAPLLVVADAEGGAAVALNGAPLRPAALRSGLAREALTAIARRFIGADEAASGVVFGVGGGDDRLALAPGAVAVARIGPALAETADAATLMRPGQGALIVRFPDGRRLTTTGLDAARSMALVFADGRSLSLSDASLAAERAALDVKL
ncbi:MAG: hypothetical protein EA355_14650 [Rhodobacteraceae bacterium]|nr:MAG: hypothetical protein EA355_14650 [Paracoccaceae bacterium]